jgi:5-methylcytosine-specific restriction endonuclease McrA
VYRTIKSIRVIHSEAEQRPARRWTAPKFAFLVRGHWRTYRDPSTRGHDPDGNVVFGRTWVSEHQKGEEHGDLGPLETVVAVRDPGVVISIKQPLSYARDVVEAHSRDEATAPKSAPASDSTHLANRESAVEPSNPPSEEWRVAERAKLTAALRFMILRRDRFSCQICGRNKANENFIKLEVDHKTPIIQWGRTVETNLWTLCDRCNRGKSSLSLQ